MKATINSDKIDMNKKYRHKQTHLDHELIHRQIFPTRESHSAARERLPERHAQSGLLEGSGEWGEGEIA